MKTKKIHISIPVGLLEDLDRALAETRQRLAVARLTRSDYICMALAGLVRGPTGATYMDPPGPQQGHSEPTSARAAFDAVDAVDQTTAKSKPRAIGYTDKDCLLMAKRYDPETLRRVFEAIGATDTAAQNLRIVEWQNIDGGRVKAAMARLIDAVDAGKAKNPPGLLKHLIDTLSAAEIQKTLPGGNGKPKAGGFIPKGYPPDIYNRKKFKWSRDMNGWYPRNSFGDAETTGGVWKWQPGMTKGE